MLNSTLSWWDPTTDPGLAEVWASTITLARRDQPDVLVGPAAPPPGFARIATLFVQRVRGLQADAIRRAATDVEFIVGSVHILDHSLMDGPTTTIPELQASSISRGRARQIELAREILKARERVITVHESHLIAIASTTAYALDAIADLNRLVIREHRFGHLLSYRVPTTLSLPDDVNEIGLARVAAIIPSSEATSEGSTPPTDNNDKTERSAA
ncbi:MAG: hypothetical protein QM619_02140 [Micropruina sp.]|uniref:hypothetical protein n=1 Tax=Micropruina sp. TaxID=2737536 RepID=UPI0039E26266